jgi:hypothetical protein
MIESKRYLVLYSEDYSEIVTAFSSQDAAKCFFENHDCLCEVHVISINDLVDSISHPPFKLYQKVITYDAKLVF